MMEPALIEMHGVTKHRRTKRIGPITLSIPEGYIVAIVGPNGSGKSTLMNMLIQAVIPDEGEITWLHESHCNELPLHIRKQIGFVPEQLSLEEKHSTVEAAAAFRSQWYDTWDGYYFDALLSVFGVPRGVKLGSMSKGERRKFEIAAALAPRPRLLLLDEPSSGLDPFAWKEMIHQLQECMKGGETTIVLSTHIVDEVRRLADYIVLMHHGKVLGMVEKDSLLDNWKECWISADAELVEELPGIVSWKPEGAGKISFVTTECMAVEQILQSSGLKLLKTRALELDEVLDLWIQGSEPGAVRP
ncbi:ABC transporter, ATP-binding protein [Paenibacillus algicola]|uniref:ABC transporter, ATP-binding protein n=2 Tax=Paenibacillus TaxID=44249 RepID=A0A4P8XFP6_9BACL|nr:ABC transporter, ATP-binding protein [Paenibacillus algicola]